MINKPTVVANDRMAETNEPKSNTTARLTAKNLIFSHVMRYASSMRHCIDASHVYTTANKMRIFTKDIVICRPEKTNSKLPISGGCSAANARHYRQTNKYNRNVNHTACHNIQSHIDPAHNDQKKKQQKHHEHNSNDCEQNHCKYKHADENKCWNRNEDQKTQQDENQSEINQIQHGTAKECYPLAS